MMVGDNDGDDSDGGDHGGDDYEDDDRSSTITTSLDPKQSLSLQYNHEEMMIWR